MFFSAFVKKKNSIESEISNNLMDLLDLLDSLNRRIGK